jgi:SPP1 family predicted phage head-tail adaptor
MQAGELRKRLKIQQRVTTQDSSGAQLRTWSDYITSTTDHCIWAEIEPISAAMKFYAGAEQAALTHTITIRYRTDLADPLAVSAMRGIYNNRYFYFKTPRDEGERHRWLEIDAQEGLISA